MRKLAINPYRERVDFSNIRALIPIPNLIEIQRKSYERFLQMNLLPSEREDIGLQAVFKSIFPITDFRDNCELQFVEYSIGVWECKCGKLEGLQHLRRTCRACGATIRTNPMGDREIPCPACGTAHENRGTVCDTCGDSVGLKLKYDVEECQERGMTYSVPLKVTIRLTVYDKDPESGVRSIRDIKEQEVYFGDIPLMTDNGTFIINGTERVIVSQLHRSPGVFFHEAGKGAYLGQVIPYRGSWVEFEYDQKNLLYVRIDRKRKFLATVFLRALGLRSDEEILRTFYRVDRVHLRDGKLFLGGLTFSVGRRLSKNIGPGESKKDIIVAAGKRITRAALEKIQSAGITEIEVGEADLEGAFSVGDIVNQESGEVLVECNEDVSPQTIATLDRESDSAMSTSSIPETGGCGRDHLAHGQEGYAPELPRKPSSRSIGGFDPEIRRHSIAPELFSTGCSSTLRSTISPGWGGSSSTPSSGSRRTSTSVFSSLGTFSKSSSTCSSCRGTSVSVDDIDHLGNRRVRSVGELMENQFRIGLVRMERAIKEKMSVYQEMATAMPHDLINAKPVMAAMREFFGSSQLSQFMDQTNPLSEITHKRRLSALGPGGLSRERAGFEVRDVHPTHYGRMCPIETPEGPNIGLISSLSCYARINEYGFIESPYKKVSEGRVLEFM